MGLSQSEINWLQTAAPYAAQQGQVTGLDPNLILAQAALESGYGQSGLAQNYNNYFGIKGSGVNLPTTECNSNGQCYQTSAGFASYPNMASSFDAYGKYINAHGLSGYATDPNYQSKLQKVMSTIQNIGVNLATNLNPVTAGIKGIGSALGNIGGISSITDGLGITGGCSYICQLKNWLAQSHFWQRIAIGVLALIVIMGALYMLGRD